MRTVGRAGQGGKGEGRRRVSEAIFRRRLSMAPVPPGVSIPVQGLMVGSAASPQTRRRRASRVFEVVEERGQAFLGLRVRRMVVEALAGLLDGLLVPAQSFQREGAFPGDVG